MQKLHFTKCEIPNCVLEVEFKLTELAEGAADDSGEEETKDQMHESTRMTANLEAQKSDETNHLKDEIRSLTHRISTGNLEK